MLIPKVRLMAEASYLKAKYHLRYTLVHNQIEDEGCRYLSDGDWPFI